ncbi:YciI family protein [Pseudonocardia sp. T1-2H]|uniref:YciI family protein n=1 Tax=Pseudonocardia sp. T1-2H TaxID=3128899 RepID=UPI0031017358
MPLFAVIWRYTEDTQRVDEVRPLHRKYLSDLVQRGIVREAGPWSDGTGGLLVFDTADEAELKSLLDDDPCTTSGVLVEQRIHEWKVLVGPLSDRSSA